MIDRTVISSAKRLEIKEAIDTLAVRIVTCMPLSERSVEAMRLLGKISALAFPPDDARSSDQESGA